MKLSPRRLQSPILVNMSTNCPIKQILSVHICLDFKNRYPQPATTQNPPTRTRGINTTDYSAIKV